MLGLVKKMFGVQEPVVSGRHEDALAASEILRKEANRHLAEGRLPEAEQCYRQAIAACAANADAHLGLGFVLFRQGQGELAAVPLSEAVRLNPKNPDAHYLLGVLARQQGRPEEALARFESAWECAPEHGAARQDLCDLLTQHGQGQFNIGEFADAVESLRRAAQAVPDSAEAHSNLGYALRAAGDFAAAETALRQALALNPSLASAHFRLAHVLSDAGKDREAIDHLWSAVGLDNSEFAPFNMLGHLLFRQGNLAGSAEAFERSLAIKPDQAEANCNLGIAYLGLGKAGDTQYLAMAETVLLKSLALEKTAWATCNLGSVHYAQGRLAEARQMFLNALAMDERYVEARKNIMALLAEQGHLQEAADNARILLAQEPDNDLVHSCLLFFMSCTPGGATADYAAEARRYGQKVAERIRPFADWKTASPETGRPLCVGLVSGDLIGHPVAFFLENILHQIDPARIRLHAYETRGSEDETSARLKPCFAAWRSIRGMDDAAAAQLVRDDGIDLLVDLSGHTEHNRLGLFARKPAPVQATWLGYWASTGLPTIDYFLADRVSIPEARRADYVEQICYLPDTRLCFTPPAGAPPVAPLPALRNGFLTFGNFQKLTKLNDGVLSLWGRIFAALPAARLRLQTQQFSCAHTRADMLERLERHGIPAQRVDLREGTTREAYLAAHAEVDLILDSFPYPGGTTTCEALWMGVPTMTLAGETLLARQGASMMTCAGLADWVADDTATYLDRLLAHVGDLGRLARLRAGLRAQAGASPLFDAARFASHLEDAFVGMWRAHIGETRQ